VIGWPGTKQHYLNKENGYTLMDVLLAVSVSLVLAGLAVKPIRGFMQRLEAKNVNEGLKHYITMVRSKAIANPNRHCGVVFKLHASNSTLNDSVIAFFDVPANNVFDPAKDALYSKPYVIPRKKSIVITKAIQYPDAIVFRGDGSAHTSLQIKLTLKHIQSTLDILASTGRVKVVMK
jgi:Tfp pilus assembly protein FimT